MPVILSRYIASFDDNHSRQYEHKELAYREAFNRGSKSVTFTAVLATIPSQK